VGKRFRNAREIGLSSSANSPDGAGKGLQQVRPELVGKRQPMLDEVLAGPDQCSEGSGGIGVRTKRSQAVAIGAKDVGQDVGIEAVVLVAGRAVAKAQGLHLTSSDHDHLEPVVQQRLHRRAVWALDRDPSDLQRPEPSTELLQPRRLML
jgi:hypothetical protein